MFYELNFSQTIWQLLIFMTKFIKQHPLATVMMVAVFFRLLATLFSKGYMASDDHFQTVHVAYCWLQDGLWGPNGFLTWKHVSSVTISRFPLYTLFLYLNMKIMYLLGFESLNKIMYEIRFVHALFSLLGVWFVYKTVELVTASKKWALLGGLFMAAHFIMPFLAVRNLIEMVGGTIWVIAFYYFYKYKIDHQGKWLIIAGIITALAWMVRFELIFAFWIIPFLLWYRYKNIKPALYYGMTVLVMLILAGFVDLLLLGTFMGSSINHIKQGLTEGPVYHSNFLIYTEVLIGYFIPPFSLLALFLAIRKRFWGKHFLLFFSTLSFFVIHTVISSRQERYMIPIISVLILMVVLVLHQHYLEKGFFFKKKWLFYPVVYFTLLVNMILIFPFTLNYAHKGMVEPLVKIEQMSSSTPTVLFFSPDHYRNFPYLYAGFVSIGRKYIFHWSELNQKLPLNGKNNNFDYYLLYPLEAQDLPKYIDSLSKRVGPLKEVFYVSPSLIDNALHWLNPKHNRTNEVWGYQKK